MTTTPLCAVCGCVLSRSGGNKGLTTVIDHASVDYRPRIGWCEAHFPEMMAWLTDTRTLATKLTEIRALGVGRVVERKAA